MKINVVVLTFNHQEYLQQALDGIDCQEIDADIEIIIHDDASSDATAEIIKTFSTQTRHSVKYILQKSNKVKSNISIASDIWPYCTGDYVAICDGDDYWCNPKKLATQIDMLKQLPEVDVCFHPATLLNDKLNGETQLTGHYGDAPVLINLESVIDGDGGFMPTCSLLFRAKVIKNLPRWFFKYNMAGDYFLQVLGALSGGALYLPNVMSVYRTGHTTSFSEQRAASPSYRALFEQGFIRRLCALREHLPTRYTGHVDQMIARHFGILATACHLLNDFSALILVKEHLERSMFKSDTGVSPEVIEY